MHFQFEVAPPAGTTIPELPPAPAPPETAVLLRQLLEVQRELLQLQRAASAAHDNAGRWKSFLGRWQNEFADLPGQCKRVLPALERAYLRMIAELTGQLHDAGSDGLDNDFVLSEFLDRYGMRLGQLGTILSLIAPLAEVGSRPEE